MEPPGKFPLEVICVAYNVCYDIMKSLRLKYFLVWSYDPYISILVDLICKLISQSDKMIQIRTLEIYTSLLEQTIVEENVLLDEPPKRSDLAQEMFRSCHDHHTV